MKDKQAGKVTAIHSRSSWVFFVAVTVLSVAVVDQVSKMIVLATLQPGVPYPVLGTWFRLYLLFNSGAAFSFGQSATWVFTIIQLAFIVIVAWVTPKIAHLWGALGLGLIAGGAAGNVIDRLCRAPGFFVGHVVDFISVGKFAVFNIADSAITIGVIVIIVAYLRGIDVFHPKVADNE